MKMGAWPAMAPETVRFVGQAVAVVIAETKNQAQATRPKPWSSITRNCRPSPDIRAAIKPGAPQLHPEAPGNVIYDWTIGDEGRDRCRLQVGGQCRLARHHQQPPGAERDGAARGDRRI